MPPTLARSLVAEFLGTAFLVFLAVGAAVAGFDQLGPVGVAFAFGFVLLALAYAIGPLSGCHINPAVTLGVLLSGGMVAREAAAYWIAQFAGAIGGAALLELMTSGFGDVVDQTDGALGSNDWGATISGPGAFLLEVLLTFVLVLVVLMVTAKAAAPGFAGLAIGLTLTAVHLVGIPLDGTSVNPARSLGPALFAGGVYLEHVWLFIVAPLIGGAIAVAAARLLAPPTPDEPASATAEGAAVDRTGAELPPERRPAEQRDGVPTARPAPER